MRGFESVIERIHDTVTGERGFRRLTGFTLLVSMLIQSFLFPGMGGDAGEQLIFAQSFDWGYQPTNPPLFTWLVIALQAVTGPSAAAVMAVKFALLFALFLLIRTAGARIGGDARLGALMALSLFCIFHVAWDAATGYSHSVLVAVLYAATVLTFLRLDESPSPAGYVLFGLCMGLGLLAKYAFALFLPALLGAALMDANMRRAVASPWLVVSILVAALVATPHGLWLADHMGSAGDGTRPPWNGLVSLLKAAAGFLATLLSALAITLPRAFRRQPPQGDGGRLRRFVGRLLVGLAVVSVLAVLGAGADKVRTHYMFVLVLFPPWFLSRLPDTDWTRRGRHRLAALAALAAVLVPAGLVAKYVFDPFICGACERHTPYDRLAKALEGAGFRGGTIVAYWHPFPLAGNLKARFPDSRVLDVKHPSVVPPRKRAPGQCLLVWTPDGSGARRKATVSAANAMLGAGIAADAPTGIVGTRLEWGKEQAYRLAYLLVPQGTGNCR